VLVSAEVALAYVLLIGAALMTQTLAKLLHQSPGFRTDHLLTFDLPAPSLNDFKNREAWIASGVARLNETEQQLRRIPGVADVAASNYGILGGMMVSNGGLQLEGSIRPAGSGADSFVSSRFVSPTYFRTLGIRLLRGREFTNHDDRKAAQVTIVNETMARTYWGTLDVLGKRVSISTGEKGQPIWDEIIGVVADTRVVHIRQQPPPQLYFSLYQIQSGPLNIIARTAADPDALAGVISRTIWAKYPDQPITHLMTMTRTISESVGDQRMVTVMLGIFAGIGLTLALVGVYGVVSYSVTRRTQEIGLRMALGAGAADVLSMVIRQGIVLIATGTVIGLTAALAMTRFIAGELYGVKPNDPATLLMAIVLILLVGGLACWTPARRAMRVDPMVALRYE